MREKALNDSKRWFLALVVVALVSSTAAQAKRYMTSDFRTTETRPATVGILPPHAEFIKKKVLVSHALVEEAAVLERWACSSIAEMLEAKGYDVKIITADEINGDPELKESVRRINERYDEEWRKIIRKPKKVRARRYHAGEEIRKAALHLGVDGIVIPRIQAVGATKGQKAMAYIFGGSLGYTRLDLSVVDGKTGSVEAYFIGVIESGFTNLTNKPGKMMMKVTKAALKKYPRSGEVLRPKGPAREARDEDEDETETVVLGDLEALLGSDTLEQEQSEDGGSER